MADTTLTQDQVARARELVGYATGRLETIARLIESGHAISEAQRAGAARRAAGGRGRGRPAAARLDVGSVKDLEQEAHAASYVRGVQVVLRVLAFGAIVGGLLLGWLLGALILTLM